MKYTALSILIVCFALNTLAWAGGSKSTAAASGRCEAKDVELMLTTFNSQDTQFPDLGRHVATALVLQAWQTLRLPLSGRSVSAGVVWDVTSSPPASIRDIDALAAASCEDAQIVIWGRTWHYGGGYVLDPTLAIRPPKNAQRAFRMVWPASLGSAPPITVGLPETLLTFTSIVLSEDLLAELTDPGFLPLYDIETCSSVTAPYVGDYFEATQFTKMGGQDVALVHKRLGLKPDSGCVKLPGLILQRSNLIRFGGGLVAFFREEWSYARELLKPIVSDPTEQKAVRAAALIYIGVAADHLGEDPLPSMQQAYQLNNFALGSIKYLCMAHLRAAMKAQITAEEKADHLRAVTNIVAEKEPLFARGDPWIASVRSALSSSSSTGVRQTASVIR